MRDEDGSWRRLIVPLGIPVTIIADDPQISAAIRDAYAEWSGHAATTKPRLLIRLETARAPSVEVCCAIAVEGSRLSLRASDHRGHADAASGSAFATVPRRLLANPAALAAELVDTLLLFLLTHCGRTPLHAAGVMVGNRALALIGPSGSGKSTLALAAAGKGLRVLSEDTLYVERGPPLRLWGWPRPVHVFAEEAPGERHAVRERGGKRKAIVPLPPASAFTGPAERIIPVLLERGDQVELRRLDAHSARACLPPLDPGFDLLAGDVDAALDALVEEGAWQLTLGPHADEAIDRLAAEFSSA